MPIRLSRRAARAALLIALTLTTACDIGAPAAGTATPGAAPLRIASLSGAGGSICHGASGADCAPAAADSVANYDDLVRAGPGGTLLAATAASRIRLLDGAQLRLRARQSLGGAERFVLEAGEALFDHQNAAGEIVVEAGTARIQPLDTRFSVSRETDGGVSVAVVEGGRGVVVTDTHGTALGLAAQQEVDIDPQGALGPAGPIHPDTLRLWDTYGIGPDLAVVTPVGQATPPPAGDVATSGADWSRDGARVAVGGTDGVARIWDVASGQPGPTLRRQSGAIYSVAWSRDGTRLATAGQDGSVVIWDAQAGRALRTIAAHDGPCATVDWSRDGRRFVTAGLDGLAKVWDAASGQALFPLRGHAAGVYAAAWSPDGARIATASLDGTAALWSAATGDRLRVLRGHTAGVLGVAWRADSAQVITAGGDGTARIWDVATGQEAAPALRAHGPLYGARWSPDTRSILTTDEQGLATILIAESGQARLALPASGGPVFGAAWSPDSRRLATTGGDGSARIWDAAQGAVLLTLGVKP
jgi:WD40 repeat protein